MLLTRVPSRGPGASLPPGRENSALGHSGKEGKPLPSDSWSQPWKTPQRPLEASGATITPPLSPLRKSQGGERTVLLGRAAFRVGARGTKGVSARQPVEVRFIKHCVYI